MRPFADCAVGPRRMWVSSTRPSRSTCPLVDDGELLRRSAELPLRCEVLCIERKRDGRRLERDEIGRSCSQDCGMAGQTIAIFSRCERKGWPTTVQLCAAHVLLPCFWVISTHHTLRRYSGVYLESGQLLQWTAALADTCGGGEGSAGLRPVDAENCCPGPTLETLALHCSSETLVAGSLAS
jgi:hypothetical protein